MADKAQTHCPPPKSSAGSVRSAVDLGSRVRKGQAIARIDPSDYRLRVDQAEAALQQARVRLGLPAEGTSDKIEPEQTATVRQAAATAQGSSLDPRSHDETVGK